LYYFINITVNLRFFTELLWWAVLRVHLFLVSQIMILVFRNFAQN